MNLLFKEFVKSFGNIFRWKVLLQQDDGIKINFNKIHIKWIQYTPVMDGLRAINLPLCLAKEFGKYTNERELPLLVYTLVVSTVAEKLEFAIYIAHIPAKQCYSNFF